MATPLVSVESKFMLPSAGKFPGVPSEVMLRAMTTMEEKQRMSDNGMDRIPKLIRSCITSPENVDTDAMPMFDIIALMYQLRIVTFGGPYDITCQCTTCGKTFDSNVDLSTLEVNFVPDDFEPTFKLPPLPVSGDVLECCINTMGELRMIETEAKKHKLRFPDYVGDPDFIYTRAYRIVKKGRKEMSYPEKVNYVEKMSAADLNAFDQWYNELIGEYGIDSTAMMTCPHCSAENQYALPINAYFFRPKVPSAKR